MFENIQYSYSIILSHYTFALLALGSIASFYSNQVASAMSLVGLLGLLSLNVSATYFVGQGLPLSIGLSLETMHLLRLIILCWLPWSILRLCTHILGVHWPTFRRATLSYSVLSSTLYLLAFIASPQSFIANSAQVQVSSYTVNLQEILKIAIYFVLALFSILLPIGSIKMGIGNTLGKDIMRRWYQNTAATMLICAMFQVLAFIPLYLSYFSNVLNLGESKSYIPTDARDIISLYATAINIMPIYYLFFTLPFLFHILYILLKNSPTLCQKFPKVFAELTQHPSSGLSLNIGSRSTAENQTPAPPLPPTISNDQSNRSRISDKQHLERFSKRYNISKREFDVLIELIQGRSYAAIAETLYISLATVKSHIYSIYRKTEVKNKIQLLGRILNE